MLYAIVYSMYMCAILYTKSDVLSFYIIDDSECVLTHLFAVAHITLEHYRLLDHPRFTYTNLESSELMLPSATGDQPRRVQASLD